MRKLTLIILVLTCTTLAACGSTIQNGSNAAKISHAAATDATAAQVHSKLRLGLGLHSYAGVSDVFTTGATAQCDIDTIVAGPDAADYTGDPDTLMSPDGQVAVKVGEFQGTPASACLKAVDTTLGWP